MKTCPWGVAVYKGEEGLTHITVDDMKGPYRVTVNISDDGKTATIFKHDISEGGESIIESVEIEEWSPDEH